MTPVFLLLAHRDDSRSRQAFAQLCEATSGIGPAYWLRHVQASPAAADARILSFTDADMATLGFPYLQKHIVPGSAHFPLLWFARRHPGFSHYWLLEYDVVFAGRWQDFFNHFAASPADFLSCHIRRHAEEPLWGWWHLGHPQRHIPVAYRLRSFNPLYRISAAALAHIDACHRAGWWGHNEVILPTLIKHAGLRVQDFGGSGAYVAAGDRERFYMDDNSGDGRGLLLQGSMRWQPAFRDGELMPSKLHHPVKE